MPTVLTHDPAAAFVPAPQLQAGFDRVSIDAERPEDHDARERLLDRAFGPSRFGKTCERLRARRLPADGLSLIARVPVSGLGGGEVVGLDAAGGEVVGTVRLWHVAAGGVPALMLGPLAVDARWRCAGIGARLMEEAITRAAALGHGAILLVGDAPYYTRFGFERRFAARLRLPGPVDPARFLARELRAGSLSCATGPVRATGAIDIAARRRPRQSLRRAA